MKSGRANRDARRRDAKQRVAELRSRLIERDILGVYADDEGPDDENEYDDLIAPIMRWLAEGADSRVLSARIVEILHREYGLDMARSDAELALAASLVDWWNT